MKAAVSINLSSEPFRRDRPFLVAAVAGTALLAGLLAWQVALAFIQRTGVRETREAVEQTRRQMATINAEQARLQASLSKPENSEAFLYSVFLNNLLLRKGISWTRIFADLEEVMPHNVRLIAVRPQVTLANQIQLDMTVGSQTPEPVIDMLMKLEGSPLFGATAVGTWLPPSQSEPLFRYRITANYAPKL
jgi:type IV pilus assembly protein PilN